MSSSEGALRGAPPRSAAAPGAPAAGRTAGHNHAGHIRTGGVLGGLARLAARVRPEPLVLALLAGALNLWDLSRNGWANTYYAAAVHSMSESWHNFLFASFDPSGVMTVDKPPLALWVQTASVEVFGFHPLAILAPQALMGVASVLLVYDLVRRRFGRAAGFLAGLVLALTPISVAISRHNNPDALLVLLGVAALWCALRALEDGRTRWFVLSGVCVGLGFETKMLAAVLVVPGIAAAWVWMSLHRGAVRARTRAGAHARAHRPKTTLQALAAGGAALLVGGAWPALVELTPAADRPWISGTANNTAASLIFEYNGLGRLEGQAGGPQALGGSNLFGGSTGPLRLLGEALGGQAGWLLGFALVAGLAILAASRLRRSDPRSGWLLLVGGAFATTAVVFSFAGGIFHPYYVSLLAPLTAALIGAGFAELRRAGTRARALSALAVAAGVATELAVLHDYPGELRWLTPVLILLGALAAALLLVGGARLRLAALTGALALLLVAPATWAVDTLGHATSGTFPAGGPTDNPAGGLGRGGPGGAPGRGASGTGRPGGFAASGAGRLGAFAGPGGPPPQAAAIPPGGAPAFGGAAGQPPASGGFPGAAPGAGFPGAAPGAGSGTAPGSLGATSQSLRRAVRYADAHGGGTVAVASQSEAASLVITGAHVAGIGGFSGRESETTAAWLAGEVRAGHIRWVQTTGGGPGGGGPVGARPGGGPGGARPGGGRDLRVGSGRVMAAVEGTCQRVGAVSGLYDCAGRAAALATAGAG